MLNHLGMELALDQLTDPTNGINKVSIFTDIFQTDTQTITWNAAVGVGAEEPFTGSVSMNATDLIFNITAGATVQAVGLYKDSTYVGYIEFATTYYFANSGTFTLTDVTINLANV